MSRGLAGTSQVTPSEQITQLPPDLRYEVEERAAILEYDAGLSREDAERQALQMAGLSEGVPCP